MEFGHSTYLSPQSKSKEVTLASCPRRTRILNVFNSSSAKAAATGPFLCCTVLSCRGDGGSRLNGTFKLREP